MKSIFEGGLDPGMPGCFLVGVITVPGSDWMTIRDDRRINVVIVEGLNVCDDNSVRMSYFGV